MEIIEKLDALITKSEKSGCREATNKLNEVKGLAHAYQMKPDEQILYKMFELLMTATENLMCGDAQEESKGGECILDGFERFLIGRQKRPSTAAAYRSVIQKLMNSKGVITEDQFDLTMLEDELKNFQGRDKDAHNMHVAALKQYKVFLEETHKE